MWTMVTVSQRGAQRGLTRSEFAVSVAIYGVLAGIFLGVALYYVELGEKTEVELTVLNIRAGIRYQIADRMFHGNINELASMNGGNPLKWLAQPPAGYVGELRPAAPDSVAKGRWYFDVEQRELRYRPRLRSHLSPDISVLRWRVVAIHAPGSPQSIEGLTLVNVEPYRWF
jgi:hypothetical protein